MKQTIVSNCTGRIRTLLRRCRNADNRRRKIQTSLAWHANTAVPPWRAPLLRIMRRPVVWQTVAASTLPHSATAAVGTVVTFCDERLDVGLSQNSQAARSQSATAAKLPAAASAATSSLFCDGETKSGALHFAQNMPKSMEKSIFESI